MIPWGELVVSVSSALDRMAGECPVRRDGL
jgi:hypothetical protein